MTANERFEIIGELYAARYKRLRPGKSEAIETGRDSSSEENHSLFENWFATQAFSDAIERIADMDAQLADMDGQIRSLMGER
jgi:hypothetical protein